MKKKNTEIVATGTSNALTLPATQPKPTKTDIINAMTERSLLKQADALKAWNETREALRKKIEKAALAEFERNQPTPKLDVRGWSGAGCYVEIEFRVNTPVIGKMITEYNAMKAPRILQAAEIRRQIREQMTGPRTDAVQTLLANPEAVKALDESLAHLGL